MVNGKTLYSKLEPKDVSPYVIVSGDPWRAEMAAQNLDDAQHIAFSREFNTYTGYYKGLRVTVSSTGMGAPSAIEMLEELYDCGAKVVLRMGTAGPYDDDDFGKFMIATSGWAEDEVSREYAPVNYPIVVDHKLVECLQDSVQKHGYAYKSGIVKSNGGGSAAHSITKFGEIRRSKLPHYQTNAEEQAWGQAYGLTYSDMESAPLIKVGNLMGITVGSLCLATVLKDRSKKMMHTNPQRLQEMQEKLCLVALEGVYLFHERFGAQ